MFSTVLIANRGEIACRIIATLRRMGVRSVAVYSDADAGARHVHLADEAVRLGPAPAAQSYLDIEKVIAAARATGAEAIHPGYGFLAENADFARACAAAGIVFIGPDAESIRIMGDKITAKLAVQERGVPTVPGIARPGLSDDDLIATAADVGFPLLIKPSAGGGGKGMHVVARAEEMPAAVGAARREAAASFGDDTLFLERYLLTPRHIEVQILADGQGNVIHLGERECSLQRRHQKVIEEAPSPLLDDATRERIGQAACETARSVDYRGAGTVEFIVEADRPDEFFFMEMNTRLQVEHPVTEEVTGIDLVEQQVRIAAGQPLALTQRDIVLTGHAIEARVYAEDPAAGFLPTGGVVARVVHPRGEGIRVDTAIEDGLAVSIDYDPMIAKIITHGRDRAEALRRMDAALDRTAVFGFETNVEFVRALLQLPAVRAGDLDTGLIARELDTISFEAQDLRSAQEAALILDAHAPTASMVGGPWARRDGWRLGAPAARVYHFAGLDEAVSVTGEAGDVRILTSGGAVDGAVRTGADGTCTVVIDGAARTFAVEVIDGAVYLTRGGAVLVHAPVVADYSRGADADAGPALQSPMPGTVVMASASSGDRVEPGDAVVVVEAMKMEHVIRASVAGTVTLDVAVGDTVARGQRLAIVAPDLSTDAGEKIA